MYRCVDFDVELFVKLIVEIEPAFVSIGGESHNYFSPQDEPTKEKLDKFISELKFYDIDVKLKSTLQRLLK